MLHALLLASAVSALPVPKSVAEVESQLSRASEEERLEALANVAKACRGQLRLVLRDHAGVIAKLDELAKSGSSKVKRGVLDAARCFRPAAFSAAFARLFADEDAGVRAYALEIASNTRDAALVDLVLDAEAKGAGKCTDDGLSGDAHEACVWAAYAPSTMLDAAKPEQRERAATLAVSMLEAASPKVREVAVESLAATKLAKHAPKLAEMIEKEQKKGFDKVNDAALIKRFQERLKALQKG